MKFPPVIVISPSAENPFPPLAPTKAFTVNVPAPIVILPSDLKAVQYEGSNPLPEAVKTVAPESVTVNVPPLMAIFPFALIPLDCAPATVKLNVPPVIVIVFTPVFMAFTSALVEVMFIVPPEIAMAASPASIPSPVEVTTVTLPSVMVKPSEWNPSEAADVIVVLPPLIVSVDEVLMPCFFKPVMVKLPVPFKIIGPLL